LHLSEGALLVTLIGEANKTVSTRHAGNGVSHDFSALAARETRLEKWHQDVFVDLWSEVSDEDREFWSTVITVKSQPTQNKVKNKWAKDRDSDRLSASPPPEAQFNLNGREVLGIMLPLSESAFEAASALAKSMKQ
jgi:hypothetical protein